jgi:predicted ATPase
MLKKIIAISATHGCGKTTMVYALAAHLKKLGKNVVVLNELARECPFEINQKGENRTQVWLIAEQVKRELELMDRYDYVICDRSLFDAYAYATYLNQPGWSFRYLYPYIEAHVLEYYQRIFILDPTSFAFNIEDGVRDTDEKFRIGVHSILTTLIRNSDACYRYVTKEEEVFSEYTK